MQDWLISLPVGQKLNEFVIEAVLGQGAFGITYRAFDSNLQQTVAIKEYFPRELAARDSTQTIHSVGSAEDKDTFKWGLSRFLDEARLLGRLKHPSVVGIKRFFESNGTAYLVMDYCDGEPLDKIIQRQGKIEATVWRPIFNLLLDGLEHVHNAGVLHRDIKPANIFLREDGTPVLLDFGAARVALESQSKSVTSLATAGYAPFEQYSTKGKQGPWSDLYGLAATAYRALTGLKPQDSPDRMLEDNLAPVVSLMPTDTGQELFFHALDQCLALRPEKRPQSVREFRALVEDSCTSASIVHAAEEPDLGLHSSETNVHYADVSPGNKFPRKVVSFAAAIIFVLIFAGFLFADRSSVDGNRVAFKPPGDDQSVLNHSSKLPLKSTDKADPELSRTPKDVRDEKTRIDIDEKNSANRQSSAISAGALSSPQPSVASKANSNQQALENSRGPTNRLNTDGGAAKQAEEREATSSRLRELQREREESKRREEEQSRREILARDIDTRLKELERERQESKRREEEQSRREVMAREEDARRREVERADQERQKKEIEQRELARREEEGRRTRAALDSVLEEGEMCFNQKKFDCAIASANAALKISQQDVRAIRLREKAEDGQKRALSSITIR